MLKGEINFCHCWFEYISFRTRSLQCLVNLLFRVIDFLIIIHYRKWSDGWGFGWHCYLQRHWFCSWTWHVKTHQGGESNVKFMKNLASATEVEIEMVTASITAWVVSKLQLPAISVKIVTYSVHVEPSNTRTIVLKSEFSISEYKIIWKLCRSFQIGSIKQIDSIVQ